MLLHTAHPPLNSQAKSKTAVSAKMSARVYTPILTFHSWLRWITLLLAVGATLNAIRRDSDISQRPRGRFWDVFFMMALDIQVIAGLLLYFRLSPFSTQGLNHLD